MSLVYSRCLKSSLKLKLISGNLSYSCSTYRRYSTDGKGGSKDTDRENDSSGVKNLIKLFKSNDQLYTEIKNLQAIIANKNLVDKSSDNKLTMLEQMQILMDKDVKFQIEKIGSVIKEQNIKIEKGDVKLLFDLLKGKIQ